MTPLLILSDAPCLPTGLGRIARDLTYLLWSWRDELQIEVAQLGLWHDGSEWPWPVWKIENESEWGYTDLATAIQTHFLGRAGVIFTIWDPARCMYAPYWARKFSRADAPVKTWGYFAVDAEGRRGGFGGPAADTVRQYDRVLAYGPYGARVLKQVLQGEGGERPCQWLPHGLDLDFWSPVKQATRKLIGALAANQIRKDFGILFEAWSILKDKHPGKYAFWLHTDIEVRSWSVPELAAEFGFGDDLLVTRSGEKGVGDEDLRALYSQCIATVAPGLGEGFGYPIIESLACGAPVVHVDYAGGAELVPRPWRVTPERFRLESTYVLKRPVLDAGRVAEVLEEAVTWAEREPAVVQAYCQGAVAHLGWSQINRRWKAWTKEGLRAVVGT